MLAILIGIGFWLIVPGVLFAVIVWLLNLSPLKNLKRLRPAVTLYWREIFAVFIALIFVVFYVPFLANFTFDPTTSYSKFWLQTVAGNWSPDSFPPLSPPPPTSSSQSPPPPPPILSAQDTYVFSVSACIAFFLNNGIIFLLLGFLWKSSNRRTTMQIIDALKLKSSFAEAAAEEMLEDSPLKNDQAEILKLFDAALKKADKDLAKHLPAIDPHVASQIFDGHN